MENDLVLILVVALVVLIIRDVWKKISGGSYIQRKVLSNPEQVAYWRLAEAFENEKVIFSQVAFSQFIGVEGGTAKQRFAKFARARQKVADFVICNKDFSIYAIVEIDDKTHDKEKDRTRDAITEEAGIKTFRFEARRLPDSQGIRKVIDDECLYIGRDSKEDPEFTF